MEPRHPPPESPEGFKDDFASVLSAELTALHDRLLAKHEDWLRNYQQCREMGDVKPRPEPLVLATGSNSETPRVLKPEQPRLGTPMSRESLVSDTAVEARGSTASISWYMNRRLDSVQATLGELTARLGLAPLGLVEKGPASKRPLALEPSSPTSPMSRGLSLHPAWAVAQLPDEASLFADYESEMRPTFTHIKSLTEPDLTALAMRATIVNPNSNRRLMWEVLGIALLVYDTIITPVMLAFPIPLVWCFIWMDWATTLYWATDMLVNFRLAYYTKGGVLVTAQSRISWKYVTTWFPFDFALLVCDAVSLVRIQHSQVLRFGALFRTLRILRFLRLLRLAKLKSMIHEIRMRIDSQYLFLVMSMVQHVVIIVVANHLVACAWYGIGSTERDDGKSWVVEHDFRDASVIYCYLTSLHWSLTQFTPASMDVQPHNVFERCFAVFVLGIALVVFGSFLSSITATITALRQLDAKHEDQFWLLRKYLRQNHFSRDLSMRVTRYLQVEVSRQKTRVQEGQIELLSLLSAPLRIRLKKELFAQYCKHPFFEAFAQKSAVKMSDLCVAAITQQLFSKGDVLFYKADAAQSMYFVSEGELAYLKDDHAPERLGVGRWCTEAALWMQWQHRGDMCVSYQCSVFGVDAEQFRKTLTPLGKDSGAFPRLYAYGFVHCMRQLATAGEEISDLRPSREEVNEVLARTRLMSLSEVQTLLPPSRLEHVPSSLPMHGANAGLRESTNSAHGPLEL